MLSCFTDANGCPLSHGSSPATISTLRFNVAIVSFSPLPRIASLLFLCINYRKKYKVIQIFLSPRFQFCLLLSQRCDYGYWVN